MKIIALDSSGLVASVAIVEDDNVVAEYSVNYKKTHSQTLLPMLQEITNMVELDFKTIDAIAVAKGPGSFTGLRIGSATAKGLGLAWDKPLIGVPTVDGLAYNLYGTDQIICPIMDARRGQVYTGIYEFIEKTVKDSGETVTYQMQVRIPQCAVMLEEIVAQINEIGRKTVFLGDGVPVFAEKLKEIVKVPFSFAPPHRNRQRASSIGMIACQYYAAGQTENAADFKPEYLRMSQAERERLAGAGQ